MRFITELPTEECRIRLSAALHGYQSVQGKVKDDDLRIKRRIFYANEGRPCFYGKLVSTEAGTVVEGHFDIAMSSSLRVYAICWLSFLALGLLGIVFSIAMRGIELKTLWDSGFLPVILLLIPFLPLIFVVIKILRWMDKRHKRVIVDFLKRTLDATEEIVETGT